MNRFLFTVATMLFLIISCRNAQNINESKKQVEITIEQNGKLIKPSNGVVTLDRKEFNIILDLPMPMAVLVNTSFDETLLNLASKGKQLATRSEFQEENMIAVTPQNRERIIYIEGDASSPWFYENEQDNNFNKIEKRNNRYQCTRTINHFFEIAYGEKVALRHIDQPIYLVFVPRPNSDIDSAAINLEGKYLKIEWTEDDKPQHEDLENVEQLIVNSAIKIKNISFDYTPLGEQDASQDSALISGVIKQLNLEDSEIATHLITSKVRPKHRHETIIVIPEITEEVEYYFEYNTYLVIVNNETGKITHSFMESSATNNWISDAIQLKEIIIDNTPFPISENNTAFGLRVFYEGMSKANPYRCETISLFIKSEDSITKLLHNYALIKYGGEWDTNCAGEFHRKESILLAQVNESNHHNDILVETEISEMENYEDENGDCNERKTVRKEETVLVFNGEVYQ